MPKDLIRLRIKRSIIKEPFESNKVSMSKGIGKILDKYSERVQDDVLKEFLKNRR